MLSIKIFLFLTQLKLSINVSSPGKFFDEQAADYGIFITIVFYFYYKETAKLFIIKFENIL